MPRCSTATVITSLLLGGLAFVSTPAALADELPSLGTMTNHSHAPIHVRSKPVIERLPIKVIEPVDLVLSNTGHVFVADRKAACVFRLDEHGSVSMVKEHLHGIERIQTDDDGSLYILTSTGGESALHQVTVNGHYIAQTFPFPASAFVRDQVGNFVLAVKHSGRLVSVPVEGEPSNLVQLTQTALDLTLNAGEQLEALLPSGHIVRIEADGTVVPSGFAAMNSKRLASLKDGSLLSLAASATGRSQISRISREDDRPDEFETVATVPAGTNAAGFDALGNLCLVNADLRAIIKVTSQFQIACPHCEKPTRLIFSPDPQPADEAESRSF